MRALKITIGKNGEPIRVLHILAPKEVSIIRISEEVEDILNPLGYYLDHIDHCTVEEVIQHGVGHDGHNKMKTYKTGIRLYVEPEPVYLTTNLNEDTVRSMVNYIDPDAEVVLSSMVLVERDQILQVNDGTQP